MNTNYSGSALIGRRKLKNIMTTQTCKHSLQVPSAGQVPALALAGCSLPVSSTTEILSLWDARAEKAHADEAFWKTRARSVADAYRATWITYETCARELRREMGLSESRQPEENAKLSHAGNPLDKHSMQSNTYETQSAGPVPALALAPCSAIFTKT